MPSTHSTTSSTKGGRRTRRRSHKRSHKNMRGGKGGASEWQMANLGTEDQQWNNVFVKGGPFGAAVQNLAGTQPSVVAGAFPSAAQLNLIQSAGSRKRRGGNTSSTTSSHTSSSSSSLMKGGKRSKRGGYWGNVISQALVPFSLLFAQNRFGKTRKHRK